MAIGSEARSRTNGRLHESTRGRIKEYVLAHGLKGGDALPPEGRLAQELGISRTSVREAVKALESLGILEARPGVGLFVRSFSFDPIIDNLGYSLTFDKHRLAELLAVRKQLEAGFVEAGGGARHAGAAARPAQRGRPHGRARGARDADHRLPARRTASSTARCTAGWATSCCSSCSTSSGRSTGGCATRRTSRRSTRCVPGRTTGASSRRSSAATGPPRARP